jgi:predicted GH43/DUF377 family glycosyl hydrolase
MKSRKNKKTKKTVRSRSAEKRTSQRKVVPRRSAKKKPVVTETLRLERAAENPLIAPTRENEWEAWQTFNPGVILLNDNVHFIYRAIGADGISRFGYARSSDGFKIEERLPYPIYEHRLVSHGFNYYSFASGGSFGGAEDPRIVQVDGEDTLYMTYTACDAGLRVGLTSIKVEDFLQKRWKWKPAVLISPPGETHKNWVIFPDKINGKYAILHSITPEIGVAYFDNLDFDGKTFIQSYHDSRCGCDIGCSWEERVRGVGAPPIKTKSGWLIFYHALERNDSNKYKVGAMLLDLNDPTKILYRSKEPVLEPEEWYENEGFKSGIVYVSGAVVKNGQLLVYYGGADSYVNLAYADFESFLENLMRTQTPKLKRAIRK